MKRKHVRQIGIFVILVILLLIFYKKIFLINPNYTFLYVYGILIILVNFVMFFVSQIYIDPSVIIINNNLNHGKKKPFISIILAVHNEEKIISSCLKSFLTSSYRNKELIVVNDASTDNTLSILRDFEKDPRVKIINLEKNVGKKKAIGEGIRKAKGEIYVFTDSDSVVEPHAISRIIEIFIYDENIGAVSGHGRALNGNKNILTRIQDTWYEGQFSVKKAFESVFGCVTCISGPLAAFRKDAIFNFIPAWENDSFLGQEFKFATDRTLTGFVLGCMSMGDKLKKKYSNSWFVTSKDYPLKEWKLVYCKSAKVWTEVPDTFKKLIRQQIRWKKSFVRNIFFTGKFYWKKPLIPAIKYYCSILFVLIGPFIVFRHLFYLPIYKGEFFSFSIYILGVLFIGLIYSVAFKLENPQSNKWVYRPLMSLLATMVFTWLIFYSIITIRKSIWHRG